MGRSAAVSTAALFSARSGKSMNVYTGKEKQQ